VSRRAKTPHKLADLLAMIQAERRAVEQRLAVPGPSVPAGESAAVGGDNTPTSETVEVAQEAMATDLSLASREMLLARLNALRHAEDKIREGTYGLCEICGEPIPLGRLRALPEATRCVRCAEGEGTTQ
jgi:DnaK suppressor protein